MASPTSGAALGVGTDAFGVVNGVRLHWVAAGDEGAPLVVLLHGFPDFWFGWRHQLPALAAAGFRAVALDLRGYNLSERPPRVEDYARDALAADVAALIERLGAARATVVGHDWGGVVAWLVAATRPDLVERLVIVNAPHPARFRRLVRSPRQALRSWYVALFQLPWLPERLLRLGDSAALRLAWRGAARGGARELEAYRAAFAERDAVRAAVDYYRALPRRGVRLPADRRVVAAPTLLIWAERDVALVPENADGLAPWVPDLRVVRLPRVGHFAMAEAPGAVNAALLDFLRGGAPPPNGVRTGSPASG